MVETDIKSEIVAVTKVWLKKHNWNMRLIKKGDNIHKSILTHVYFHRKSLKFLRIIHQNNSIYVYLFWKDWTKFIEKRGKNYDNKNKHLRRFHTQKKWQSPYLNFKHWKDKKIKITSLLLHIMYIKDLQDKWD